MIIEPFGKKNPFPATVIDCRPLTGVGSAKETIHIEFSLEGSGLEYTTGDALAVIPCNDTELVEQIIQALGFCPQRHVPTPDGDSKPLTEALTENYDITNISKSLLTKWNVLAQNASISTLLEAGEKETLSNYCWGRDILDLLIEAPINFTDADQFVGLLKKIMPRLYSIASSPKAHLDEVHLCVGAVRYTKNDRARKGVCSTYMADRLPNSSKAKVFIHVNKNFRVPEDPQTPIIMVGPGTGIAPFRAFWEERVATNAPGSNWLFFGNPYKATDACYQDELAKLVESGDLKLSIAWSRDQAKKIYVQHLMINEGAEIWAWLEKGAAFYICGDASRMAKDVELALQQIIKTHGVRSEEESLAYLAEMKSQHRYQRDVY